MAKRNTGLGRRKKSHSRKTKKRTAIKHEMLASRRSGLAKKAGKRRR